MDQNRSNFIDLILESSFILSMSKIFLIFDVRLIFILYMYGVFHFCSVCTRIFSCHVVLLQHLLKNSSLKPVLRGETGFKLGVSIFLFNGNAKKQKCQSLTQNAEQTMPMAAYFLSFTKIANYFRSV